MLDVRNLLQDAMSLIRSNRRKGQTTRLVEMSRRDSALLVVATSVECDRLRGASPPAMASAFHLSSTRGADYPGGVVFDNHAICEIMGLAAQEIASLDARIASLEAENVKIKSQMGGESCLMHME